MSVVLNDLSFSLPDGRVLFSRLNTSFTAGRTGLTVARQHHRRPAGRGTGVRWASRLCATRHPPSVRLKRPGQPGDNPRGTEGMTKGMELLERTAFLDTLAGYADDARLGDGRLVLVSGESGMGKTVLAEAFRQQLTGARWLWGSCDGLLTPRPLGPLGLLGLLQISREVVLLR